MNTSLTIRIMILLVLSLSLIMSPWIFTSQAEETGGAVDWCTYDEGITKSKITGRPIYLEFSNYACGICLQQNDTYLDPEVVSKLKNFVCININPDTEKDIAAQFDIILSPTILFLMPNGTEIFKISGYLPPPKLVENMTEALAYYDFNYIATFYDPIPSNGDNSEGENSDNSDSSSMLLPMVILIVVAVALSIIIVRFVIIFRKYK